MDGCLKSPDPGAALSASKQDRWTGQANRLASFLKESAISGARFAKRQLPRFKVFCVRASRSAAMVLVAMSLWLTYMDWAGIRLLSDEFGIPHSRLFRDLFRDDSFLLHLTASAFVFLYGAISLGILILGNRIPLAFAAVGVFAGAARLSTDNHGLGHDISHMIFASCSGYSDMLANIGVVSLIATGIMATASWATRPSQARDGDFEAATP
jgi:hypothetical protein